MKLLKLCLLEDTCYLFNKIQFLRFISFHVADREKNQYSQTGQCTATHFLLPKCNSFLIKKQKKGKKITLGFILLLLKVSISK